MGGAVVSSDPSGPVAPVFTRANLRPAFYCSIAVLGAVLYGYDGSYFTGVLGQTNFRQNFGDQRDPVTGAVTGMSGSRESLFTSLVQAGEVIGCISASVLGDFGGRKGVFFAAASFVALGAILQMVTNSNVGVFSAGRFLLGMGVGQVANSTPLYLSEIAPNSLRSIAVSCWQLLLAIGQVIGACVNQGTKGIDGTASYQIPIGLNLVVVLCIWVGLLILPESPRWLVTKRREEEALKSLRKVNKSAPDAEVIVQRELKAFQQTRDDEEALSGEGGWATVFKGPELRKLIATFGILASQQISGVQFIFSYTTTFMQSIGLDNAFLITIIVTVIEVIGVLVSFLVSHRYPVRFLLLSTSVPMFASLFVCGGLGTIDVAVRSNTENRVIAAMIMIYVFFFNVAWGPLAWVVASELSSGKNKSKIMAVGTAAFFIVAFVVTFTLPYLFNEEYAGLNAQVGWIYGVGAILAMVFVYFYIPETRGRTLEEITEMMEARIPTRKWDSYVPGITTGSGIIQVQKKDSIDGSEDAVVPENSKEDIESEGFAKKKDTVDDSEPTMTGVRDA